MSKIILQSFHREKYDNTQHDIQEKKKEKSAKEFEAMVLGGLLKDMYKDIPLVDGENKLKNDFYQSMLLDEMAKGMVKENRGLHLSDDILKFLHKK